MILVVGSTGMLGGMVARDLLSRGERVRVLVRTDGEAADSMRAAGAEVVTGDLKDLASLAKACVGVRQVVTTANSAQRGGADTAETVDRNGNIALIDAAKSAGVEHFVFVSALGADPDSPVEFMRAKAAAESRLKQSGMRYTILQPNLFMEVWIGMVIGMPLQQGQPVTLVGTAKRRHTFISMEDVAAFTVAACTSSAALDRTLVIGGPDAVSWLDVVGSAERVIGRTIPVQSSTFLEVLRRSEWVPTKESGLRPPAEVYVDTPTNRTLVPEAMFASLAGSAAFLGDVLVQVEPTVDMVLETLSKMRRTEEGRNLTTACKTIYAYLARSVPIHSAGWAGLAERMSAEELIHLPRRDRQWWSPGDVFWYDASRVFQFSRGYVDGSSGPVYPHSLRPFFEYLGVKDKPVLDDFLRYLRELNGDPQRYREVEGALLLALDDLPEMRLALKGEWDVTFMSTAGQFLSPSELYVADDAALEQALHGVLDILSLPFPPSTVRHLIAAAGFGMLSDVVSVSKHVVEPIVLDPSTTDALQEIVPSTFAYLEMLVPRALENMRLDGAEVGAPVTVRLTSGVEVTYRVRRPRDGEMVTRAEQRNVYLSPSDRALYLTPGAKIGDAASAKELCRLFPGAEREAYPFVHELLRVVGDATAFSRILKEFDVERPTGAGADRESLELIAADEEVATMAEPTEQTEAAEQPAVPKPADPKPPKGPPPIVSVPPDLVDPDAYVAEEEETRLPYASDETGESQSTTKTVLRAGRKTQGRKNRPPTWNLRPSTLTTEEVALRFSLQEESRAGNVAEDRHSQKGIGYDIYSTTPEGIERFIEVKGFRDTAASLSIRDTEWLKAEQAGESFLLHVWTGLSEGGTPTLMEIPNPVKYLHPDLPGQVIVTQWQTAVTRKVRYGTGNSPQSPPSEAAGSE